MKFLFKANFIINSDKAFSSMVWLLCAILIFSIAAVGSAPLYSSAIKLKREAELVYILKSYKKAIMKYKSVYGLGPAKLSGLIKSQPNPRFLRMLYDDPFYRGNPVNKYSASGLVPVFSDSGTISNVKSASREKGVNGITYSNWYVNDELELRYETGSVILNK